METLTVCAPQSCMLFTHYTYTWLTKEHAASTSYLVVPQGKNPLSTLHSLLRRKNADDLRVHSYLSASATRVRFRLALRIARARPAIASFWVPAVRVKTDHWSSHTHPILPSFDVPDGPYSATVHEKHIHASRSSLTQETESSHFTYFTSLPLSRTAQQTSNSLF
ncbi:uncharacterized protein FOMMEDRAFT_152967 [Fomitiporia mediterranea MF3/22]|uniref:uncharacterized protein n=1 Tax=Fomitiporia mediterranea (strain MF3/22) TaxID=694068 RepID=UPI00044093F2|nr:uncharacterized protein FOMMEDRAFT_152967 [Fomitiporia mediterranea MF3/22]EJD05638.1 hypothetical protein FOMMEDRAFT_152967 [Fomitiporia mediterranea MF3/22]